MSVEFNKDKQCWCVNNEFIKVNYYINKFGLYAELLAKASDQLKIELKNIILIRDNYCVIRIISKSYGIKDVLFDVSDLDLVLLHRWCLCSKKLPYCCTNINGKSISLHSLIFERYNNIDDDKIIDHYNRNNLDCRRSNLREITQRENCQNRSKHKNNSSGIIGIRKRNNSWVEKWRDVDGKEHTKTFSENKYKNAKELAIFERNKHTKHYNKLKKVRIKRII
jgi:hypothetical protein